MIGLPAGTRVWVVAGHTDMRKGFDGLAALVQTALAGNPFCGHVFVFRRSPTFQPAPNSTNGAQKRGAECRVRVLAQRREYPEARGVDLAHSGCLHHVGQVGGVARQARCAGRRGSPAATVATLPNARPGSGVCGGGGASN